MKILWLTWKDLRNPLAGGAERVNEELARRLVRQGHEVIILTAGFAGAPPQEKVDGYTIIRVGSRWTVYIKAYFYYRKHLRGWANLVIDEVNTLPFFAKFYVQERNFLFIHQLCREIWFYQMFFPLSLVGYLLEPLYFKLIDDREVITISESSKCDLIKHGFKVDRIHLVRLGVDLEPLTDLEAGVKFPQTTFLCLGEVRPMKRTLEALKIFTAVKAQIPQLRLVLAGAYDNAYGEKVKKAADASIFTEDIQFLGRVSAEEKRELMRRAHFLLVTSLKEGWGLVVTEAGTQGTPAAVYDVDGLRDSVRAEITGLVARKNQPEILAEQIVQVMKDPSVYSRMRHNAWEWNRERNFELTFQDFEKIILNL